MWFEKSNILMRQFHTGKWRTYELLLDVVWFRVHIEVASGRKLDFFLGSGL